MACEEIQSWSFPALVGAFLDLAIAYLLLCASASAFLASCFLRLFGLRLPCPCNGLFGDPTGGRCLQRLLVAEPGERVASVQRAVKGRFPFDAVCAGGDEAVKLLASADGDGGGGGGGSLCEEASCGLRRRRHGGGSVLSAHVEEQESSVSYSSGDVQLHCDAEFQPSHGLKEERMLLTLNDRMSLDEDVHLDPEQIPAFEVFGTDPDVDQATRIKVLERALEGEKAARAALHQELESERNAAASAADEAMGMILRLQQEKASIEMEARQFQRLIEEKSAYDEEEMHILKEILVRREREKLVLEKELEAYREMMAPEGGIADMRERLYDKGYDDHIGPVEGSGLKPSPYIDDTDDPTILLQQISESIEKKGTVKGLQICLDNSPTGRKQGGFKILPSDAINPRIEGETSDNRLLESLGDINSSFDFEEKNIVSTDGHKNGSQKELNTYVSMPGHLYDSNAEPSLAPKGAANGHKPENPTQVDSCECVSFVNSQAEVESSVLDVHVVDDISQTCNKDTLDRKESSLKHSILGGSNNWVDIEENIHRRNSDIVGKALEQDELNDKTSFLALRRNSFSAVDHEKFKIKAEVGWLTERLKLVQKGRERLNSSLEIKEKHKLQQLQLLEEICSQVEEIQYLNPLGANGRRVSLPPPSSKAKSKKRRCRSVSLHESTD